MSTAESTRGGVCPVYVYMNHGTYCSWYALHCPGCLNPVSVDGACNLKVGCPQSPCPLGREQPEGRDRHHYFHSDHKKYGMYGVHPTSTPEEQLKPGATIVHPDDEIIRYVRFRNPKQPEGTLDACVCWVRVTPRGFADSGFGPGATPDYVAHVKSQRGFERGIGYEVLPRPDSEIDRSVTKDEVQTWEAMADEECLTLLVHIRDGKWYEYHVTLLGHPRAGR